MAEKDEGLLLTYKQFVAEFGNRPKDIVYNMAITLATPIIEKRQQEKDTAYYAEMMKEAIDRVRTEAKKQERERIIAEIEKHLTEHGDEGEWLLLVMHNDEVWWQALKENK